MIRYYITDRRSCPVDLIDNVERWAKAGLEMVQIREKDLSARALADLVSAVVQRVGQTSTKVLVNGRVDVALACGAHGVHLPSDAVRAAEWRRIVPKGFLIGVSCHGSIDADDADFAVFSPVFESPGKGPAAGLEKLGEVCRLSRVPVLALGGVTWENAKDCLGVGAAGIAGIRLFQ